VRYIEIGGDAHYVSVLIAGSSGERRAISGRAVSHGLRWSAWLLAGADSRCRPHVV